MALLSREQILQAQDLSTEIVPVPEWSGEVFVKALPHSEWRKFLREIRNAKDESLVELAALVKCVVDDKGTAIFTADDIKPLAQKSPRAIDRLLKVFWRLNGLGNIDQKKDVSQNQTMSGSATAGV